MAANLTYNFMGLSMMAVAEVPTPAPGIANVFTDAVDGQVKQKNADGTATALGGIYNQNLSAGGAIPQVAFASVAALDGYTLAASVTVIPAMPGKFWIPIAGRAIVITATGTCTGATAIKCGNNGTTDNVSSGGSVPTVAAWNGGPGAIGSLASNGAAANVGIDLTTPVVATVTTAATGSGGGTCRVVLVGCIVNSLVL